MITEDGEGVLAAAAIPAYVGSNEHLKKYLECNLRVDGTKGRLYCHVLTDVYSPETWREEPVGPRKGPLEYLRARQTILIFQLGSVSSSPLLGSPNRRGQQLLVMGMTAWEYCWLAEPTVHSRGYIQYVDTTGLYRPRRGQGVLTRAVIGAYLRYTRDVLGMLSVHWYAAARPSLLFAGSENLPRKKVLDSVSLLNWWIALVQSLMEQDKGSPLNGCDGYFYLPAEELVPTVAQCARANLVQLNRMNSSKCVPLHWHYGPVTLSRENGEPEACQTNIPLFEDDPKWRHFEVATEYGQSGMSFVMSVNGERQTKRQKRETEYRSTLKEFYQTLPYRTEFRQDPCSALMAIRFVSVERKTSPYFRGRKGELAAFVGKLLKTLSFTTESETLKSSLRLWSWLKLMGSSPFEIATHQGETDQSRHESDRRFSEILRSLTRPSDAESLAESTSFVYHDVQALVKRKLTGNLMENHIPNNP